MKQYRYFLLLTILLPPLSVVGQSDIRTLGTLSNQVTETSGLIYYNGLLITHNDSGGDPELYELDPLTLAITRVVQITNAENSDWEDITQDEQFIYIGDFGNNSGNRQDLVVYKISKSEYDTGTSARAERINFIYEDQTEFQEVENSDFDAEALFALEDHLVVLTKQWQSQGTVAYRIPKLPGAFLAERLDEYAVNGLVTGATFDSLSNTLYLVGYTNLLNPFFVQIESVSERVIFSGDIIRTNLNIGLTQVEAITQTSAGDFYISSEAFSNSLVNSDSRVFVFQLDEDDPGIAEEPSPELPSEELIVFKTAGSDFLNYQLNTERAIFGRGIFNSIGRMVTFTPLEDITAEPIDISGLPQALYYLVFFYSDSIVHAPFLKD
ncbi:MAG: T9SS C-terminal target domain-containing protein [Bacteroidota bacterium]